MENKKQFYKMVFALVAPMTVQNLINIGVTSADVIMLGKVSETVLSASSLAGQVYFVLSLIFFGLTSGAAVLTAQYWGRKDMQSIETVFGISMDIALGVSLLFTLAAWVMPRQLMLLFTTEEAVIAEGIRYMRVVACSYTLSGITMVYLNIMRSMEQVHIGTLVYGLSFLLNVILNAVFIFGLLGCPAMGIQGAALGTVCARVLELVIIFVYNKKYNRVLKFHLRYLPIKDRPLLGDFFRYAVPVTLNELVWGAGMAVITAIIGHLGQAAVAANSVAQVSRQLATVVAFGIAGATSIILGKTLGEGKKELAKVYAKRLLRIAFGMGLCGVCVILAVSPIARHFLNLSDQAKEYLQQMMYIMSYFVLCQSIGGTLIMGIFRSGGDTRIGLLVDVVAMWGFSITAGFLAAFVFHAPVPVVYLFLVSDEVIKLPFTYRRYRSMKWLRNITRD